MGIMKQLAIELRNTSPELQAYVQGLQRRITRLEKEDKVVERP